MASLYHRPASQFWWVKFRGKDGKIHRSSTGLKVGVGPQTRLAKERCAQLSLDEARTAICPKREDWQFWVRDYLMARYASSPPSLERYLTIWRNLSVYLEEKKIPSARHLTREHCLSYMAWRMVPDKPNGKYQVQHNTAHTELKILSLLLSEAVRRGFCATNPAKELGIHRVPGREKPEFTDGDIAFIRSAIEKEPEPGQTFLHISFEIARYQGCRLNETWLNPQSAVDLPAGIIRFRIKGGRQHAAPLHPKLVPLFSDLIAKGCTETYARPPNPSRKWFDFLKRIGLRKTKPGACFHCLRVTAATRFARSNVSESKAMKYIGHASTLVHRHYQRLRVEDLGECLEALD